MIESLEHVPTEDLIQELVSRFEHSVFAGIREVAGGKNLYQRKWKGNACTVHGLANDVGLRALLQLHNEERDVTEDDET